MDRLTALSLGDAVGATSLWGLLATGVLTLLMAISQGLGWSRMSIPFMIGSMFTAHRTRAMGIGIILHFILGMTFAQLYVLLFASWEWATWWLGGLLGVFHALFALSVGMPILPDLHPRMASEHDGPTPTPHLEPPGFFALNYGHNTPITTVLAHVVYGTLLGTFTQVPL